MAFQAIGALAIGAINMLRGAATVGRIIRIGNKVFRQLDGKDPSNDFRAQIDEVKTRNSFLRVEREMKKLGPAPDKNSARHMSRAAGSLAGALAKMSPPFEKGVSASEAKIEREVNQIFKPLESIPFGELVMAKNFSAALSYNFEFSNKTLAEAANARNWQLVFEAFERRGWSPTPRTITVVSRPNRALHHQAKPRNSKTVRTTFFVSGPKEKAQASIDEYARRVKAEIGKMAGGWAKCYISLGGTGHAIPASAGTKGSGVTRVVTGKNAKVMISNKYGNYNGYLSKRSNKVAFLVNKYGKEALTSITKELKSEIKKRGM